MNNLSKIILLFFAFLFSLNLSAKTKLSINKGIMKAGGYIQMPITIPKEGSTIVGLNFSPSFDYFVSRAFSLGVSPSIEIDSLTGKNIPWQFSISARGIYHFDLSGLIYPYVGVGGGLEWKTKIKGVAFLLSVPVGMMIALNSNVAIDFGVPVQFLFNSDGYLGAKLPIGYLGVQAFF